MIGVIAIGLASLAAPSWRSRWRHYRAEKLNCPSHFINIAISDPSGIAYHPIRNTLLVVSDQGTVVETDQQYKILDKYDLFGDIEAVTVHPITGTVFVASESDGTILEYDLDQRRVLRTLIVDFASAPEFASGLTRNEGLESVTFLTDDRGGNHLVSAVQSDPARLIFLAADVSIKATQQARQQTDLDRTVGLKQVVPILSSQDIGLARISDIMFDLRTRTFLVTSADDRTLTLCDPRGRTLRAVQLPGQKPEGFCFLPNGDGLLVEDTGGIWLFEKFRSALWPKTTQRKRNGGLPPVLRP